MYICKVNMLFWLAVTVMFCYCEADNPTIDERLKEIFNQLQQQNELQQQRMVQFQRHNDLFLQSNEQMLEYNQQIQQQSQNMQQHNEQQQQHMGEMLQFNEQRQQLREQQLQHCEQLQEQNEQLLQTNQQLQEQNEQLLQTSQQHQQHNAQSLQHSRENSQLIRHLAEVSEHLQEIVHEGEEDVSQCLTTENLRVELTNLTNVLNNVDRLVSRVGTVCGSVLSPVSTSELKPPEGWVLCYLDNPTPAQRETECRDLLVGLLNNHNSKSFMASGGNFGCWGSSTGLAGIDPESDGACKKNHQHTKKISSHSPWTSMAVCVFYPQH